MREDISPSVCDSLSKNNLYKEVKVKLFSTVFQRWQLKMRTAA